MLNWAGWSLCWSWQEYFHGTLGDSMEESRFRKNTGADNSFKEFCCKGKQGNGPVSGGYCRDKEEIFS